MLFFLSDISLPRVFQAICLSKFHSQFYQRSTFIFQFQQGKQEIDTLDIDENSQNILNIIKDTSSQLPEGNWGLQFPWMFLTPSVRSLCYLTTRLFLTIFHIPHIPVFLLLHQLQMNLISHSPHSISLHQLSNLYFTATSHNFSYKQILKKHAGGIAEFSLSKESTLITTNKNMIYIFFFWVTD